MNKRQKSAITGARVSYFAIHLQQQLQTELYDEIVSLNNDSQTHTQSLTLNVILSFFHFLQISD